MNITLFVVRTWGWQYREELILNSNVFVLRVWLWAIRRETETEY